MYFMVRGTDNDTDLDAKTTNKDGKETEYIIGATIIFNVGKYIPVPGNL